MDQLDRSKAMCPFKIILFFFLHLKLDLVYAFSNDLNQDGQ